MKNTDQLNQGYLSHNILYKFYSVIDFIGNKIFKKKEFKKTGNRLLFINLGLIGDLILFRYVIDDFLKLDYQVDILIQNEYKFLFQDLNNINILTVQNYKDRKIISGFFKILNAIQGSNKKYDTCCHFRAYLGTGILSACLSRAAHNAIGYGTSGFGFLLNKKVDWIEDVHETQHLLKVLQVLEPQYDSINISAFAKLISKNILDKYSLLDRSYIVIHATSQNSLKNIPKDMLRSTIDFLLTTSSAPLVFVGVDNEIDYIRDCFNENERIIISNGKISMFEVMGLASKAKLFIGIDSSIAHLSSPLKLPKVILWHQLNSFSQWAPLGDNFHIVFNDQFDDTIVDKLKSIKIYE